MDVFRCAGAVRQSLAWFSSSPLRTAQNTNPCTFSRPSFPLDAVNGITNRDRPDSPRLRDLGVGQATGELNEYLPLTVRQAQPPPPHLPRFRRRVSR